MGCGFYERINLYRSPTSTDSVMRTVLFNKMNRTLQMILKLPLFLCSAPFTVLTVLALRIIRPWLLVRWGGLISSRIGHFACNTELYLCKLDAGIKVPRQRYVDLFYMVKPICNEQLATMWKRILRVWPGWVLGRINRVNRLIPGSSVHEIGKTTFQDDRDVHNFLERFPPHLEFTAEEEARGAVGLEAMSIPQSARFVCLIVRDSAYLEQHLQDGGRHHSYRDCDAQNFVMPAEELADRGYFVIRMGAKVREAMNSVHPKVIDYAMNGMRSDFMDIYLGAKCEFCISTATGYDAVPEIFRRPLVVVNDHSLAYIRSWNVSNITIVKKYWLPKEHRFMTLREILASGAGLYLTSQQFEESGIELIENTSEEIRDVVIEMDNRLNGVWQPHQDDEVLQRRFWEIFKTYAVDEYKGDSLHGELRARFGANFLRNNRDWLK